MNHSTMFHGAILAAGLGTRLRPLTEARPKPLVPTLGRPLIDWSMLALAKVGIKSLGINTFYLSEQLESNINFHAIVQEVAGPASDHHSVLCNIIKENEILGTGGGLKGIWTSLHQEELVQNLLCLNGDALFDFSLQPLMDAHLGRGKTDPAAATLALRPVEPGDPFGRVGVNAEGQVVRIAEVTGPLSHTEVRVGAFTGAQVITEEVVKRIPDGFCDVFRTAHRDLLNESIEIRAHFVPQDTLWVDVGNQERYIEAHAKVLAKPDSELWSFVPPHQKVQQAVIFEGAEVGKDIHLGPNSWVGQKAQVGGAGGLESTIIWPNHRCLIEGDQVNQVLWSI